MKIIERAPQGHYLFRVLRPFFYAETVQEIGNEIEVREPADQTGLVKRGLAWPCDLPDTANYVTVQAIVLPGKEKRFEAKKGELVTLRACDALKLMFSRLIIPSDPNQWRPFELKLGGKPRDLKFESELSAADQRRFEKEFGGKFRPRVEKDLVG
jgi:hypothetical protein